MGNRGAIAAAFLATSFALFANPTVRAGARAEPDSENAIPEENRDVAAKLAGSSLEAGIEMYYLGKFADAEKSLLVAVRTADGLKLRDEFHAEAIIWLLASKLRQGKTESSDASVERGLAILRSHPQAMSRSLVAALWEAGHGFTRARDYECARQCFLQALAVGKRALADSDLALGQIAIALARAEVSTQRYPDAELTVNRMLPLLEKQFGEISAEVGRALNALGIAYRYQGKFAQADPVFRRSLRINEATLPAGDIAIIKDLINLGAVCLGEHKFAEAESLLLRARPCSEKNSKASYKDRVKISFYLAMVYSELGKSSLALSEYERSIATFEGAGDTKSPDFVFILEHYAQYLRSKGEHAKARDLTERAKAIRSKNGDKENGRSLLREMLS